jgi:uncharacterized protein YndB with AHSA1/START domain
MKRPAVAETVRTTIRADRAAVWALISVPANIPIWYDEWDAVHADDRHRPMSAGTTLQLARTSDAHPAHAQCTVIASTAEHQLSWIERVAGQPDVIVDFHLETPPTDLGATDIAYTRRFLDD